MQDEFAQVLLRALKQGQMLVLLSNAAPLFRPKFSAPHALPAELMDVKQVKPVLGADGKVEGAWPEALIRHADESGWPIKDTTLLAQHGIVHDNFRVVVVTKFKLEDSRRVPVSDEWPLELAAYQGIHTEAWL